jgi:hypothetical protein
MTLRVPVRSGSNDPRMQPGAYIHDKTELYLVLGVEQHAPPMRGEPYMALRVENCRIGANLLLRMDRVRKECELVRAAPPRAAI